MDDSALQRTGQGGRQSRRPEPPPCLWHAFHGTGWCACGKVTSTGPIYRRREFTNAVGEPMRKIPPDRERYFAVMADGRKQKDRRMSLPHLSISSLARPFNTPLMVAPVLATGGAEVGHTSPSLHMSQETPHSSQETRELSQWRPGR